MITKTNEEKEDLKKSLLNIVFSALISQDNETERSIIVSTYNQINEQLFNETPEIANSKTLGN